MRPRGKLENRAAARSYPGHAAYEWVGVIRVYQAYLDRKSGKMIGHKCAQWGFEWKWEGLVG
ncbi:MAG: hypothetical protein OWS74_03545, partial [Firmicutes bacterium]|nr:hypothetical protein [Bacillota bacterium]